jgi:hypothetical protein
MLTDITPQADDTRELITLIAERPGSWSAGQLLFFLSGIAWVPAGVALILLFAGRSLLGRIGGAAVLVGGAAIIPVDAAGLYLRELALSGIALDQQVAVVDAVEQSTGVIVFEIVHVAGLFAGLLIVGGVLLRTRPVPIWAAAALLLGVLGLLAAPTVMLQAVATSVLAVGLGMTGLRVARMPGLDDDDARRSVDEKSESGGVVAR